MVKTYNRRAADHGEPDALGKTDFAVHLIDKVNIGAVAGFRNERADFRARRSSSGVHGIFPFALIAFHAKGPEGSVAMWVKHAEDEQAALSQLFAQAIVDTERKSDLLLRRLGADLRERLAHLAIDLGNVMRAEMRKTLLHARQHPEHAGAHRAQHATAAHHNAALGEIAHGGRVTPQRSASAATVIVWVMRAFSSRQQISDGDNAFALLRAARQANITFALLIVHCVTTGRHLMRLARIAPKSPVQITRTNLDPRRST